ncbi:hypothetical protein Agub_g9716, partial [Astrephomene gubernaculifera]
MDPGSLTQLLQLGSAPSVDGSLLLSLHPDGSLLAAARGSTLCICSLRPSTPSEGGVTAAPHVAQQHLGRQQQEDEDEEHAQQELADRRSTHGSAGPRGRSSPHDGGLHQHPHRPPARMYCPTANGPPVTCSDDITALAWLAFVRPPGAAPSGATPLAAATGAEGAAAAGAGEASEGHSSSGRAPGSAAASRGSSYRRRTNSAGSGAGVFASIQAMLEDDELKRQQHQQQRQQQLSATPPAAASTSAPHHPGYSLAVLLSGTRGGALQLHDARSGAVLLRQQLHAGPVLSITVRTWRMGHHHHHHHRHSPPSAASGLRPDDPVEDVTVGWADAVVRLAAWELRTAAAGCYAAA